MEYNDNNENQENSQLPAEPPIAFSKPAPPPAKNTMAIASMIIGIFALLTSCLPLIGFIPAIIGIVLVILSKKGKPMSGFAIAGLVLSILALVFNTIMFAYMILVLNMMKDPEWGPMFNEMMNTMQKYQTAP